MKHGSQQSHGLGASCETVMLDKIYKFYCPHCRAEMVSTSDCSMCGAPMVPMAVHGGGVLKVCSRFGCKNHMLDVVQ